MARDDRRPGAEDLPAATDLHGRRTAGLRPDGPALSELVERLREGYAAFNRGDFDAATGGFDPDVEWVMLDWFPDPGPFRGPEGVRQVWDMWKDTFDDFHAVVEEYAEGDDAVVAIVHMVGRGKDSGATVDTPAFPMVWTLRDDLLVRVQMFESREDALEAAGLPPDTPFKPF